MSPLSPNFNFYTYRLNLSPRFLGWLIGSTHFGCTYLHIILAKLTYLMPTSSCLLLRVCYHLFYYPAYSTNTYFISFSCSFHYFHWITVYAYSSYYSGSSLYCTYSLAQFQLRYQLHTYSRDVSTQLNSIYSTNHCKHRK